MLYKTREIQNDHINDLGHLQKNNHITFMRPPQTIKVTENLILPVGGNIQRNGIIEEH